MFERNDLRDRGSSGRRRPLNPSRIVNIRTLLLTAGLLITTLIHAQAEADPIRSYVQAKAADLGLTSADAEHWRVSDRPSSKAPGVTIVHVTQTVHGLDVHNAMGTFALRDGRVVHFVHRFVRDAASKAGAPVPAITAIDALRAAAKELNMVITGEPTILHALPDGVLALSPSGIAHDPIRASLLYQPVKDGTLRLAWDLTIRSVSSNNWWHLAVDASSGELLRQNDYIVECRFHGGDQRHAAAGAAVLAEAALPEAPPLTGGYRVFDTPVESPNHGPRSLVLDPDDPLASPFGWHDEDGVDGAEYTITRGNNVYAYEDVDVDDQPGYAPDGGAGLNFDAPLDPALPPADNQDAAITNLFYWNNLVHDVCHHYGFDEQSGNFQETNYGGSGEGSDGVFAEGQDGGGIDNANFGAPPDGENGRMQMYNWTAAGGSANLTVNAPGNVVGSYLAPDADFGPGSPIIPLTGDLVDMVDDAAPTTDGCGTIQNAAAISGKFVLIDRGLCSFPLKVEAAQAAGAIGVIMVNNVAGAPIAMGGTSAVTIPSVMITDILGAQLRAELAAGNTVNLTLLGGGATQDRDGCFDNGVIAHEYGHGVSIRLTGGASNSDCLSNAEQMGEGWSDWLCLMLTMQPGGQGSDVRGIGTYAAGEPVNGTGLRPAPYSTDFGINNYTYAATNNGGLSEPHGIGFVWCTMLWDMTWALIDQYGFDPDLHQGTGGNNIAMQLVIEAMKLQPCSPGFVDGRDAILAADELLYAGANRCLIWEAFAARGLGYSADQGSSSSRSDQTEAFDIPNTCMNVTAPPTADFQSTLLLSCGSTVSFTDASTDIPQAWAWDFGDGGTSTEADPTHTYAASGTYTVTLTVTNTLGSDAQTQQVTIDLPDAPTADDITVCAGNTGSLTAVAADLPVWYDAQEVEMGSGSPFTTPVLNSTSTFFLRNQIAADTANVGPVDDSFGTGGQHGTDFIGTVNFTAFQPLTIVSAWVDAEVAGNRTFNLWIGPDGTNGSPIQTIVVNVPVGQGRIDLGFDIPAAGEYSVGNNNMNLFRNNAGAQYPYFIPGLISLTGSSGGSDFYYYLYDLEVTGEPCRSTAVEVTAFVVPGANFSFVANGTTLTFTDASNGATSWLWDFGDGSTSTDPDPVHTYAGNGPYTITLSVDGGACSAAQTWELGVGVDEVSSGSDFTVAPNPASDLLTISLNGPAVGSTLFHVVDAQGRSVIVRTMRSGVQRMELDVAAWAPGTYHVHASNAQGTAQRLLVITR